MTVDEVTDKISVELALYLDRVGDLPHIKRIVRMAITVGIEYFSKDMEEIMLLNKKGELVKVFKSINDTATVLETDRSIIQRVLAGKRHSIRGYILRKVQNKPLKKIKDVTETQ